MNTIKSLHAKEPVLTWGLISAIFNALQLLALPGLPIWIHTIIVVVATIAAVIAARGKTVSTQDPKAVADVAHDLGLIEKVAKDL